MKKCFVCEEKIAAEDSILNKQVYLHVCNSCHGSAEEKKRVEEYLDSLADGLICGCI